MVLVENLVRGPLGVCIAGLTYAVNFSIALRADRLSWPPASFSIRSSAPQTPAQDSPSSTQSTSEITESCTH